MATGLSIALAVVEEAIEESAALPAQAQPVAQDIVAGCMVRLKPEELEDRRRHRFTTNHPELLALMRGEAVRVNHVIRPSAYVGERGRFLALHLDWLEIATPVHAQAQGEAVVQVIELLRCFQRNLAADRNLCDEHEGVLWDRLDAACAALKAAPSATAVIAPEPTKAQLSNMAWNLSAKFGPEFTSANEAFAMQVISEYRHQVIAASEVSK